MSGRAQRVRIDRRSFLQRAGLLLAAVGATGADHPVRERLARKARMTLGSDAVGPAASFGPVKYVVEIAMRAGFPISCLLPSFGHKYDVRATCLNVVSSQGNIDSLTPTVGREVFFARFVANEGGDRLRQRITVLQNRIGLATSQSVVLTTGLHTANFFTRAPTGSAVCPAIVHQSLARPRHLPVIAWGGASVTNQRGTLPAAAVVADRSQFLALASDIPLYFTTAELRLIVGTIQGGSAILPGTTGDLDEQFVARSVSGTADLNVVSLAGRQAATTPLTGALSQQYSTYESSIGNISQSLGGIALGEALNTALSTFAAGAANSFIVGLDSGDWHGDIYVPNDPLSKHAAFNRYLGDKLSDFLAAAAVAPDPEDPDKMILDGLLVSLTSEFGRAPLISGPGCIDNQDGGSNFFAYIGPTVRTGHYGSISGSGQVVGFDETTGATTGLDSVVSEASVYRTTCKLFGAPDALLEGYVPGVPHIPILLR